MRDGGPSHQEPCSRLGYLNRNARGVAPARELT